MSVEYDKIDESDLVEVVPIEYAGKWYKKKPPRIYRYRNIEWHLIEHCTQEGLDNMIQSMNKKEPISAKRIGQFISYRYGNRAEIILDTHSKKLYVTKSTFDRHGERQCQHQASFVMRVLKYHFVLFKRIQFELDPYRVGKTPEDRQISINAIKHLFNDPL